MSSHTKVDLRELEVTWDDGVQVFRDRKGVQYSGRVGGVVEGEVVDGRADGWWIRYDNRSPDVVLEEGRFLHGRRVGEWKQYGEDYLHRQPRHFTNVMHFSDDGQPTGVWDTGEEVQRWRLTFEPSRETARCEVWSLCGFEDDDGNEAEPMPYLAARGEVRWKPREPLKATEQIPEYGDLFRLIGEWEDFYPSGKLEGRSCYDGDGFLQGVSEGWHEDGRRSRRTNYVDDQKHGEEEEWWKNGRLTRRTTYDQGKPVVEEHFNPSGVLLERSTYRWRTVSSYDKEYEKFRDGRLLHRTLFTDDPRAPRPSTYYHPNGQVRAQSDGGGSLWELFDADGVCMHVGFEPDQDFLLGEQADPYASRKPKVDKKSGPGTPGIGGAGVGTREPSRDGPDEKLGLVYALINPAMPGLVKIGKTDRSSEERAQELSASTGTPTPLVVAYEIEVPDATAAERWLHAELSGFRYSENREFFKVPLQTVVRHFLRWESAHSAGSSGV